MAKWAFEIQVSSFSLFSIPSIPTKLCPNFQGKNTVRENGWAWMWVCSRFQKLYSRVELLWRRPKEVNLCRFQTWKRCPWGEQKGSREAVSSKNSTDGVWLGSTVTKKGRKTPERSGGVSAGRTGHSLALIPCIRQGRVPEKAKGCDKNRKTGGGQHVSAVTSVDQD